jgi:hypothetical protein
MKTRVNFKGPNFLSIVTFHHVQAATVRSFKATFEHSVQHCSILDCLTTSSEHTILYMAWIMGILFAKDLGWIKN